MRFPFPALAPALALLFLSLASTSVRAQCDTAPTTIQACDDGDPCTVNDSETILDADASICIPCAGILLDCSNGMTTSAACDDGNPATINDSLTILNCDASICLPCQGIVPDCDNSATTTRPCNDRDPCTENDEITILVFDGTTCVPCAGTPVIVDCTSGPTTILPCDDGNSATINDTETILDCAGTVCIPCAGVLIAMCDDPAALIDLEANAVRARLTTNGSLWNGTYAVTDDEDSPNLNPVNAIRTGALWIGGRDPGGELFVRAPLYGTGPGSYGYQPGPLIDGETNPDTCAAWDRFFVATEEEVTRHREIYWEAIDGDSVTLPLPLDSIPASFLGWPAFGNPHFEEQNGFALHDIPYGLAPFWDEDSDGIYDPTSGDYPLFCGTQGIWSVFNTANAFGENTAGRLPLQIDVLASAPDNPNPDLQRTTFYTYTIRHFGQEDLIDAYVGHFIDSDLGCTDNDRTGSIPESSLFYSYNDEATEGPCAGGEAGYGDSNPVNVFQVIGSRFPENSIGESLQGMQNHLTFYSEADGNFPAGTHAPATPQEAYNFLQGWWGDGNPLYRSGNGYDQPGAEETRFSFDGVEVDGTPWNSRTAGVPATDVRSVYGIGPFDLRPGGVVRFTLAVTTLFNVDFTADNSPDRQGISERAWAVKQHFDEGCPREINTALDPEPATAIGLEVFPNPASDLFTFRLPETERAERLELIDLTGRVIVAIAPAGRDFTLNVSEYGLKAGTYFYRLYTASERLVSGKVVVR